MCKVKLRFWAITFATKFLAPEQIAETYAHF